MSKSEIFFSNNIILNDIAVNPNWNVIQSILKSRTTFDGNPYEKHPQEEVDAFMKSLKSESDSTTYVLNHKQPNIWNSHAY